MSRPEHRLGVSASPPRHSAEPEPCSTVSADRASVANAIARALRPLVGWSERRLSGTPAERLLWRDMVESAPQDIIETLHGAGFAIVEMGAKFRTQTSLLSDYPYHKLVRVRLELLPSILGAEKAIPDELWQADDFRREYLPRELSRLLLAHAEKPLTIEIAQAIEAQRAATGNTDAVEDESAVANGDAPGGEG